MHTISIKIEALWLCADVQKRKSDEIKGNKLEIIAQQLYD
jgi:hypothetical protein